MRKVLVVASLLLAVAAFAGAPLKGVDVKLGKNPGGSPAKRTTDPNGNFDFGVVPQGSYSLTLVLPDSAKNARRSTPATCEIEITGAEGGTIKASWDFEKGKRVYPPTERRKNEATITLNSDGKQALKGTVVASK